MIEVRLIVAGREATARIDPSARDAWDAVDSGNAAASVTLIMRLLEAVDDGTWLTPTGPLWRHRVPPWTEPRELAIALAAYIHPDDPLARMLAEDAEIAELVRVPEGAIA